jgi:hypothetical protein
MGAVSGLQYGVGARFAAIIPLDVDGKPDFTTLAATNAYNGLNFQGFHSWEVPSLARTKITHMDNDGPAVVDFLPPKEGASATLKIGVDNQVVNAFLQGVKKVTIGEATGVPYITDKMGFEPTISLFLYQQSKDKATRLRRWRYATIPSALCIPDPGPFNENAQERTYQCALNKSTKQIWGVELTEAIDGCLEAALFDWMAEGIPTLLFWNADGIEDEFLFEVGGAAVAALSTAKITVWDWDAGTPITSGITKTTAKITFSYPPTTGHVIVALIER